MENQDNIGFVGSQGYNQYSNPYNNDLYSQPSIKRKAQKIAEQNKRASQEFLNKSPTVAPESAANQKDISDINIANIDSNNNISEKKFEESVESLESIVKSNDMGYSEKGNSQAFLIKNKNTTIDINDEDEKSMKPPRKHSVCCMCCPLWLCVSITVAIIAFIGIMVYVFWPKIPDVNIASISLSEQNGDVQSVRYQIPNSENGNKGGVEIDLDIHVTVKNDNFYDLHVHNLDTRVFLQTDNLDKTLVGKGNSNSLKFEKHKTTEFVLPLTIGYYVDDILKDNALIYLLKACSSQTPVKIQYEVDIGIFLIENIYTPTYKGNQSFSCPVGNIAGGLSNVLLSDIYSNISQYFSSFL